MAFSHVCPAALETADRPAWLALRRDGIGGSDIAAILGLDTDRHGRPRRTAWQVYLDKTGALPDTDPDGRLEELLWWGHEIEPVAAKRFRQKNPGVRLARMGMVARTGEPWMRANIDRRVYGCPDGPCGWECKNRTAWAAQEWDLGGNPEQVPDGPAAQCHWGMIVTGWRHWHLSALIGGNELRSYRIDADDELHATMREEAAWFWHDHVEPRVPPPIDASELTGRILARMWDADPGLVKTATGEVLGQARAYYAAVEAANRAILLARGREHELQAWLGDAEIAMHPVTGKPVFTWKRNGTFAGARFRQEQPAAVVAAFTRKADAIDTGLMKDKDPELYRAYRARKFLMGKLPEE